MISSSKSFSRRTDLRSHIRRSSTPSRIPRLAMNAPRQANSSPRMPGNRGVSTRPARTNLLRGRNGRDLRGTSSSTITATTPAPTRAEPPTAIKQRRAESTATHPTFSTAQKARPILPITPPRTPKAEGSPPPSRPNTSHKSEEAKAKSTSITVGPHMCAPCSKDCLRHTLSSCKHTVMTEEPEHCATNCVYAKETPQFGCNTRDLDKAFVCPVCLDTLLAKDLAGKQAVLNDHLKGLQALLGYQGQPWYKWSTRVIKDSREKWLDDEHRLREALEEHGRKCQVIRGDVKKEK